MAESVRSGYPAFMRMNITAARIVSWLGLALVLTGCIGYVQGDGGDDVVAQPDLTIFGGYVDGGPARDYGRRGAESRGRGGHAGGGRAASPAPAPHAGGGERGGGKR
jgi:hypothetical protein